MCWQRAVASQNVIYLSENKQIEQLQYAQFNKIAKQYGRFNKINFVIKILNK